MTTALTGSGEEWRAMQGVAVHVGAAGADQILTEAKARIAHLRQSDVTLRLLRPDGSPASGVQLRAELSRHAFAFGDQTWELDRMHRMGRGDSDRATYWRRRFAEVFNAATTLCYWTERDRNDGPKTEDEQGRPQLEHFAACVDWAVSQGLTVKGHPLVWSIPKAVPTWLGRYDYATQMKFLEVRVRSLVARFRGRVTIWDVVNEALWEPLWAEMSQRHWPHIASTEAIVAYVAPAMRWCREEDSAATLLINDYGMEHDDPAHVPATRDGVPVTAAMQRRRMLDLIGQLQHSGAAPDAIGMQSHTGGWIDPVAQTRAYDELAQAGLPLHVTEFWADTHALVAAGVPEQDIRDRQQQYVLDHLACAFGHPAIEAFFFWGFMESAIRWDRDHSGHDLLQLHQAVQRRLRDEWTTRTELTTDAEGVARFRGFHGDYLVHLATRTAGPKAYRLRVEPHADAPHTLIVPD